MLEAITLNFIFQFMLIFLRFSMALMLLPGISAPYIPSRLRLANALCISFVMSFILTDYMPEYSEDSVLNLKYLLLEMLTGIVISIGARLYYLSLQVVGQIISMQSGLSASLFFDPINKMQVSAVANFINIAFIFMLFATNTHYLFISAIADSYIQFPVGEALKTDDIITFVISVVSNGFLLSFKLASPFVIVAMAVMVGSGLLSRLIPSMQVFFVISPLQILISFCVLYTVLDVIIHKLLRVIIDNLTF